MTNQPFLTIGMPHYDDYDGAFFTLQSIRLYHPEILSDVELMVVDNNPTSKHGVELKKLMGNIPGGVYHSFEEWKGPWVKDVVFRQAKGQFVLCLDSHVLIPPGALRRLVDFYKQNPSTNDFYQGPLLYDSMRAVASHFEPIWRGDMWGIWASDNRADDPDHAPFEIPMQGMGLFSCRRDAWIAVGGFNRMFSGFGGEEGYIHTKFRNAGHKTWCLPFLRWLHRFGRPGGVPYVLTWENKVRNYLIGFTELGLDTAPIIEHFAQRHGKHRVIAVEKRVMNEIRLDTIRRTGQLPKC